MVERNQETYNTIFMFFVAMYCLERIQFVNSFTITFAIARTGIFVPIGEAVKKICNDEFNIHAVFARTVLEIESKTERGQVAFYVKRQDSSSIRYYCGCREEMELRSFIF